MHPILSWGILLLTISLGYIAFNGVPRTTLQSNPQESQGSSRVQKRNKRHSRASRANLGFRDTPSHEKPTNEDRDVVSDGQSDVKALGKHPTSDGLQRVAAADNRATGVQLSKAAKHKLQKDSVDPLENVMNGRPRKASTPIGMRASKLASPSANESDEKQEQETKLQNHVSKRKTGAHVTDDMLPTDYKTPAKTLKIIPATNLNGNTHSVTKKASKSEEQMTKKQRQNAAKKLKAKAEKAEAGQRQAAALRTHQKNLEAQKIAQLVNRPSGSASTERENVWRPQAQDWQTVTKNKKPTNDSVHGGTSTDALIWDV